MTDVRVRIRVRIRVRVSLQEFWARAEEGLAIGLSPSIRQFMYPPMDKDAEISGTWLQGRGCRVVGAGL